MRDSICLRNLYLFPQSDSISVAESSNSRSGLCFSIDSLIFLFSWLEISVPSVSPNC